MVNRLSPNPVVVHIQKARVSDETIYKGESWENVTVKAISLLVTRYMYLVYRAHDKIFRGPRFLVWVVAFPPTPLQLVPSLASKFDR